MLKGILFSVIYIQAKHAACALNHAFFQSTAHAIRPLQQIVGTLGFSANIIYPRLSAPRDGCLLLFLWFV